MTDLDRRMKELDELRPPDLWQSIQMRAGRPQTFIQRILSYFRLVSAMQMAALALALAAIIGAGAVVSNLGVQEIGTASDPANTENVNEDEISGGLPIIEEDSDGGRIGGLPIPGVSSGTQGSSNDSGQGGSRPGESSQHGSGRETAGPPVFHTDQAHDAYGSDMAPNAALSQSSFDILRVDWGPVAYESEENPGGYSISITLAGSARTDGSYNSFGVFPSGDSRPGEECQLYHSLIPGTTAYANALCGSTERETRRLIGRVQGGPVTSAPTADGGTRLSATFDNRDLPSLLKAANRTLRDLSSFTCMQRGGRTDCTWYDNLDNASSTLTYRI